MITFPTVQTAVNVLTVWIVNTVNICVLPASILKSLNVLLPDTIETPVPVVAFHIL